MVCVGEGENALIDLCDRIERGTSFEDVTNLWVKRKDGSIKRNPISKPVDINAVPMIDVSLFEDARLYRPMAGKIYRMLPIETVRGCPYTCTFCNSPDQVTLYKREANAKFVRKRRMDLVYKELKYFKENLQLEYAYFWADTFLALNKREFDEFCEMYSDIRLPFWMQTRPETISHDNIRRLADIGLHRVSFGIEHGNEEFRARLLDRRWKNPDIIEALKDSSSIRRPVFGQQHHRIPDRNTRTGDGHRRIEPSDRGRQRQSVFIHPLPRHPVAQGVRRHGAYRSGHDYEMCDRQAGV